MEAPRSQARADRRDGAGQEDGDPAWHPPALHAQPSDRTDHHTPPHPLHWPAYKLVVETDGRGIHDNPYAFEEDRRRDLDLELADWHVIRLTWHQIAEQRERVLALLRKRLTAERSER